MPPTQASFISSTLTAISNHLKPHKAEAMHRIRTNALCLITTLVVSYLLPGPLPSIPTALRTVSASSHHQPWTAEWVWEWVCVLETGLVTVLCYNVLEGIYAIQYPRAPLPPVTSPAKKAPPPAASNKTPKRTFTVLSPNSSPQPQKPFAFSPSSSMGSLSSASIALSSSTSKANPTYAQSPLSTPSRVLHYSVPPGSSTDTQTSSTSEYLATPSPVISAYRAKHAGVDIGRPLDGSFLMRILPDETSDSEDS